VIVMTASRDERLVMDAVKLGITDYILKPFEPESLTRRFERIFLAYGYPLPFHEPQATEGPADLPPPAPMPPPPIEDDPIAEFSLRPVTAAGDLGLVGPLPADSPTLRLLDVLPQMVWVTGPDGRPEYLNPRAQAFLDGDATAAAGWGWLHLLHPDDVQEVRRLWTMAVRTGQAQKAEYRLQTRPRHYRWCEAEWVPLTGEHGTVLKWVGVWIDIDDRKRLQMVAQRDDRTLWRQRDAVMATDPAGRVTFWNEAATRLLGWSAEEMIGRSVLERFPDAARTIMAERLRGVMGGQEWVGRFQDFRKDGSRVSTEARLVALPRAGQARAGVLWVSGESGSRGHQAPVQPPAPDVPST
jgi:PAS domain S-box-containing protein